MTARVKELREAIKAWMRVEADINLQGRTRALAATEVYRLREELRKTQKEAA